MNAKRLEGLSRRIWAHLERERAMPWASIQYVLSEVGRTFLRVDPVELSFVLRVLTSGSADEANVPIVEHLERTFIAADATGGHAEHQVELAAATLDDQLQAFAKEMQGHRGELVAEQIAQVVPGAGAVELIDASRTELLGGSVRWPASGARLSISRPRSSPTCVWVTSDVDWVYPYDPALWRHLIYCVERQQRPIIVARKIAFSTFPLL